jgi:phosphatidylserine/phosphatidylglycerophosphate/cardiolipin synthase-like enzyme
MFEQAKENIDILAYSGLFIAGDPEAMRILTAKATGGVRVRVLLGDPDSENIIRHGADESNDVSAEIRKALTLYQALAGLGSAEIRLQRTTLHASIFRGDDDLFVNPHVHGAIPARSPVIHLRRDRGGDVTRVYFETFERIWAGSR